MNWYELTTKILKTSPVLHQLSVSAEVYGAVAATYILAASNQQSTHM